MKITNKNGLSLCWIKAVETVDEEEEDRGWISATQLVTPVRKFWLQKRHDNEIEEDVSDRIWALFGSAVHQVLDLASDDSVITEQRFFVKVLGKKVGFKPDRLETIPGSGGKEWHLKDFKITSVWSVILDTKWEWVAQINLYIWALKQINIHVTKASIEVLIRDWNLTDSLKDDDYPKDKIMVIPIEIWPESVTKEFIEHRVDEFKDAEKATDNDLPMCSEKERWARPDRFAVKKPDAQRALRVFNTAIEAQEFCQSKPGTVVEYRRGESIRCERFCSVRRWCNQYQIHVHPEF